MISYRIKLLSSTLFALLPIVSFAAKIDYWNTQRKGANIFSNTPRYERFQDAQKEGIQMVRIASNKWLNGRSEAQLGDFLIGPKDQYHGIVRQDLDYLIDTLNDADKAGIKVVLTMLSLPGSRWNQHNIIDGKRTQQYDLWRDFKYHQQCADFWKDLAAALRDHPAIVGYNIINEPCPERGSAKLRLRDWYTMDYQNWYKNIKNTPADLNLFYKSVIKAIRSVDQDTPIILDSGFYASPYALQILRPEVLGDSKIIYAIHNYVPGRYTFGEAGAYDYPGAIPTGELDIEGESDALAPFAPLVDWNANTFSSYFSVLTDWMTEYAIPANRIYISEFGVNRQMNGAMQYLKDSIEFFNDKGWHWSFYTYREDDGFHVMDYELGTADLPKGYWWACEAYKYEEQKVYPTSNPLWKVIQNGLNPEMK